MDAYLRGDIITMFCVIGMVVVYAAGLVLCAVAGGYLYILLHGGKWGDPHDRHHNLHHSVSASSEQLLKQGKV